MKDIINANLQARLIKAEPGVNMSEPFRIKIRHGKRKPDMVLIVQTPIMTMWYHINANSAIAAIVYTAKDAAATTATPNA